LPTDAPPGPAIPLGRWADRQLRLLAAETGSPRIAALEGPTLVGERAQRGQGFTIDGRASAGNGGSRLLATRDGGWFALTLIRAEDRDLLLALFLGDDELDIADDASIAAAAAHHDCADLVARGRLLGLPCASADETPVSPPVDVLAEGRRRLRAPGHVPLVVDLSAIWAGPLAGHLLWLAGAEVVRVESADRPDLIRRDDPALFALINQGKASATIDFRDAAHRDALIALIRRADLVIESSRVRALKQLGIDAEALVRETPGLVWLSVTGHGATGDAAHWTGIGNDCAVAGGLARAMAQAGGEIGYVGDAVADPLTGITAAREGWRAYQAGEAKRIALAMSAIVVRALAEERAFDRAAIDAELRGWSAAKGQRFARVPRRAVTGAVRALGADTARYFPC
jgi:hypothetical protein